MKRGQGTFEYVLLLGGVLLIVVLAVVLLRGIGTGAGTDAQKQSCLQTLAKAKACYADDGSWNPSPSARTFTPTTIWGGNAATCITAIGIPPLPSGCTAASATCVCPAQPQ